MNLAGSADEPLGLPSTSLDPKFSPVDDVDRNPVFGSLVSGDGDIVGLIAYSIYKQNKHDWLHAFAKSKGREPDDAEVFAYIIGESTSRRLATYRLLAEATLEGKGPDVHVGDVRGAAWSSARRSKVGVGSAELVGAVVAIVVVVIVLALIAAHFGLFASH
jgi:hypothetical protein